MINVTEKIAKEAKNKQFFDFVKEALKAGQSLQMSDNEALVKEFATMFSYGKLRSPIFEHDDFFPIMLRALYDSNKTNIDDFAVFNILKIARKHFGVENVSIEAVKFNKKCLHAYIDQEKLLEERSIAEMAGLFKDLDFHFFRKEVFKGRRFFLKITVNESMRREFDKLIELNETGLFDFQQEEGSFNLLIPHFSMAWHISQFLYKDNYITLLPRLVSVNDLAKKVDNKLSLNLVLPDQISGDDASAYFVSLLDTLHALKVMQVNNKADFLTEASSLLSP